MSETREETTGIFIVDAPGQYANSQLNGSSCVVARGPTDAFPDTVEVLLLDGPDAHRYWWMWRPHLRASSTPERPE